MIFFSFQVPPVALLGSSSSLCCQFVLEVFFRAFNLFIHFDILLQNGETLYSVVWYRAGKQVTLTLIKTKCFTSKSVKKMDVAPRRLQVGWAGVPPTPCGAVSKSVGQWVIVSDFGDSYCIFWACKLVLESLPCVRLPLHNALTQCPSYTDVFEDIKKDWISTLTKTIRELPIFDLPFVSGHSCAFGVDEKYETDWERTWCCRFFEWVRVAEQSSLSLDLELTGQPAMGGKCFQLFIQHFISVHIQFLNFTIKF